MREIGGYFGLECGMNGTYHDGVLVNSARNALRLIIRTFGIKRLFLPSYTCPVVPDVVAEERCEIITYSLTDRLLPDMVFPSKDFVVYNNYFGVCGRNVERMAIAYQNLIVDNAQAFFSYPRGRASFYSPRKFFGVADGGIAVGTGLTDVNLEDSHSYDICSHLLRRYDLGATAAYRDFQRNEDALVGRSVQRMSCLTRAMMGNVDYDMVVKKRLQNFRILHEALRSSFPFELAEDDVPMAYPFMTADGDLRARLIDNAVYVPTYWSGIDHSCDDLVEHVLPLPIDQRYDVKDMERIISLVKR